jgi:hypothetical protein
MGRRRKERMLDDFPDLPWLGQYILGGEDGHTPIPCYSLTKWGKWLEEPDHRSLWWTGNPTKWVSTVFLGLDHRHWGGGPPLIFETMAFQHEGRTMDYFGRVEPVAETLCQERYSSWDDAEIGHKAAVRKYLVNKKTRAVKAEG